MLNHYVIAKSSYLRLHARFVVYTELNDRDDESPKEADDEENKNPANLLDPQGLGFLIAILGADTGLRDIELGPPFSFQLI